MPELKRGDVIHYTNSYGQEFVATVLRRHGECTIVKREEWVGEESLPDYKFKNGTYKLGW